MVWKTEHSLTEKSHAVSMEVKLKSRGLKLYFSISLNVRDKV